ncbi:MAG: nucleoside hydrolase-like domain-containing protein [Candidatus Hinthialibacter sp.]
MNRLVSFCLILVCMITILSLNGAAMEKPRVIVLTDISNEPDDEESMVRFLVYSNQYDVEGLIATTSVWLRKNPRLDLIQRQIDAYAQVRANLMKHEQGFPDPGALRRVAKMGLNGFGMDAVGFGKSTEGSNHIIEVVDRPDDRPIWISIWGGANTLAQALWDVKYTRSEAELDRFVSKLRVYTISDQDNAGRWMRITFPNLFYIVTPSSVDSREYYKATWTGISGDRQYKNGPYHCFELVDNPWLTENIIQNHGPLGALYPKLEYIMEGDTPSFLNLINNGLGSHIDPSYGGWGGRYVLHQSYAETRPIYTNSRDAVTARDGAVHTTAPATIWRWRDAFQYDFAARMDWCVAENYKDANHNPVPVINGKPGKDILEIAAKPGDEIRLSAEGAADPDGDAFDITWFIYREAGSYGGDIKLTSEQGASTSFIAPSVKQKSTLHVILQLKDHGDPTLFSYRRAVITIEP